MAHINKVVSVNNLKNPTEAQDKVLNGVNFLCDAVKSTLGPYGRNFLLEKGLKVTNDGISIAKQIQLKDEIEDLAVRVARQAAEKTNDTAGDGTTTALTLIQALLKEIVRLLPGKKLAGKKSIMQIRAEVSKECADTIEKLKAMAVPVKTKEDLIRVAEVAVEDKNLAKLIAEAQWELGPEGTLVPEEVNELTDSVEKIIGLRFDNGFSTSLTINNQEKQRLEVQKVKVIMTNYVFDTIEPVKQVLDELVRANYRDIVIIGRAFSQTAILECMNNHKGGIRLYPMNAPYVNQTQVMKDLQAVLGGVYFDQEESELESMTIKDVGFAEKVVGQRYSAVFTGKKDEQSETRISHRVKVLKDEMKGEGSQFAKRALEARIAQLENGFGLVKIGALTENDRKYKFDKAEDAINAVKWALKEGTVRGAGLAYKEISDAMPEDSILKEPLLAPYKQIQANAGQEFVIEDWVRNSLKTEVTALENACQIALDLATVGGAVATERRKPGCVREVDNGGDNND